MSAPSAAAAAESPTPGAPEKPAVRSMFDRIAPRYDLLNRLLSAGIDVRWRRAAVDLLAPGGNESLLDLCAGTADLLVEALSRGDGLRGVGVDISSAMLGLGARKLARRGMDGRGHLASGDAERLPLVSACVDGAAVAFGIRNVGDMRAAFREVVRVLRPGGRFVVLEFSMPPGLLGRVYRLYFTRVLPTVGGWISGDAGAYSYLPASVERFPAPPGLRALLSEAGFASVRSQPLTGGIAHLFLAVKAG
jgi:demethylmenaquinone methyltransferase / 2-methoxy-6-polyprenyl-1,4-benzoquinol methylase